MEVKDLYDHLCLKKGLWMELVFKIMIYIINMTDFIWSYIFTCLEVIIERMSKLRSVRYMYVFLLGLNGCGCYKYENTSEKTNKNKKFNVKNWYFFLINTLVEVKIWVNDLQSQIRKSEKFSLLVISQFLGPKCSLYIMTQFDFTQCSLWENRLTHIWFF